MVSKLVKKKINLIGNGGNESGTNSVIFSYNLISF